jgi:hypothetical protein
VNKYLLAILFFSALESIAFASNTNTADTTSRQVKTKFSGYDGALIVGYVDNGGFLNFTGPNLNVSFKKHKLMAGMLPSLRFKEDKSTIKNSFVIPSLGVGLTYCYSKFVIQVPLYYNSKTTINNGRWNVGIGLGMRLK